VVDTWLIVGVILAALLVAGVVYWYTTRKVTPVEPLGPFEPQAVGDVDTMESTTTNGWWPHQMWPVPMWPIYGTNVPAYTPTKNMDYAYFYMRRKRRRRRR